MEKLKNESLTKTRLVARARYARARIFIIDCVAYYTNMCVMGCVDRMRHGFVDIIHKMEFYRANDATRHAQHIQRLAQKMFSLS